MRVKIGGMNAVSPIKPAVGVDAFHRERSRCVDAFALAEAHIAAILTRGGEKCSSEPLGAKLEHLRKLKTSPNYSAANKKRVDELLVAISALLPVRADIVHSRLVLVEIEGVKHAQFLNAVESAQPFPTVRLLTFDQMRDLTRRVDELAGKLKTG